MRTWPYWPLPPDWRAILGLLLGDLLDGLLVGDLGSAHVGLHLELTEQTVYDDLQMELAHAGDDGLASLFVGPGLEGGVLFGQLRQGHAHLLLAGLGLGLDGNPDNGVGELHGLQNDGVLLITQGVAGGGVLQADGSGDVAGVDRPSISSRWLACICRMRPMRSLLSFVALSTEEPVAQHAGIDAEEGQTCPRRGRS